VEVGRPVDQVISLRYPSYAVRHPAHICWLNHTIREYYDLWNDFSSLLSPQAKVKETARRTLSGLLSTLFNNADDVLFEMADRSRNDADQHMYFDSMREIRVQRKRITTEFGQRMYAGFDALYEPTQADEEDVTDFETAVDNLTLVKNDDLEISVAVAVGIQMRLPRVGLVPRHPRAQPADSG
jgi:hypothetical protein